ncbi:hypothetical protein [Pseudomonas cremoricolorata]|uniref:Uncharacterized protein n=1 Tax=Pseudomonas cremoricolorata TaxID=157783 RepID=A0A089YF90_9PSED|nr:hypothetical protein [Pseudomonas cremoricolorata]AIR90408.1 hypothetical protein LK03_14375 [Pseudomonas cremoricolorata]
MSDPADAPSGRAAFHMQHQRQATALAEQWLARRDELRGAWLDWVAGQLYQLTPAAFAAMVRRELQRLAGHQD